MTSLRMVDEFLVVNDGLKVKVRCYNLRKFEEKLVTGLLRIYNFWGDPKLLGAGRLMV